MAFGHDVKRAEEALPMRTGLSDHEYVNTLKSEVAILRRALRMARERAEMAERRLRYMELHYVPRRAR